MTENKRFHWDWETGRMKDTYSNFQATKDMRLIERSINDACRSYEKEIAKLKEENKQLKQFKSKVSNLIQDKIREESELLDYYLKEKAPCNADRQQIIIGVLKRLQKELKE